MKGNNFTSFDEFIEKDYGKRGTPDREKFERGYENFKRRLLLKQTRIEKGMTQDEQKVITRKN